MKDIKNTGLKHKFVWERKKSKGAYKTPTPKHVICTSQYDLFIYLFVCLFVFLKQTITPTWITLTTSGAPEDQTLPATPASWKGTAQRSNTLNAQTHFSYHLSSHWIQFGMKNNFQSSTVVF